MKNDIMLISSGYDQNIRFWSDFNNNKCKNSISVDFKESAINALELLPSKEELAFAINNSVKFLDLVSMNNFPVYSVDSHTGNISNILFNKDLDSLFFTAGEDSVVKLNDKRILKGVKEFDHSHYVNSIHLGFDNVSIFFL
jgi:WD40 repeat protein